MIDNVPKDTQELWVVSNRYERIATCCLDPKEVNFRILVGNVAELTAGKSCSPQETW